MNDPALSNTSSLARRMGTQSLREFARILLLFLVSWLFLSAMVNMRFPGDESKLSYLWPSLDVTVLLLAITLLACLGRRLPRSAVWSLAVGFFLLRLLRFGDGIERNYFHRWFRLYLDLPMLPEGVRLLISTMPAWKLVLLVGSTLGVSALLLILTRRAIDCCQGFLSHAGRRILFAGMLGAVVLVSPFGPRDRGDEAYVGAFAASIVPRVFEEGDFLLHVYGYRRVRLARIDATELELKSIPTDLALLNGANVYLFIIESYGATTFDEPEPSLMAESLRVFEGELEKAEYGIASRFLDSPVYGGSSWLAQATIASGVQTENELDYALLKATRPKMVADYFRAAGYRTVLVQPGTTRPWPDKDFLRFDARYYAWNFDYRGPTFGWAKMPDQFVVDFIHRREIAGSSRPRFIEYALVSSHAPWNDQPEVVADWDAIQDGAIYRALPHVRYATGWTGNTQFREAYLRSIRYDLQILKQYLLRSVPDDALVLILGDHQPLPAVTGQSEDHGVPLHVISRRRSLLKPLMERGFTFGVRPAKVRRPAPLSRLLPWVLASFSTGAARETPQ